MKDTSELEKVLQTTHIEDISQYLSDHKDSILSEDRPFSDYIKTLIREKGLKQQDIFINADITERYGYKLLSGEKHTKQRDVILRICYAANLTLDETQRALRIYGMPELYAKVKRDAVLMICFNERPGSIIDVNAILKQQKLELLRTSGTQD